MNNTGIELMQLIISNSENKDHWNVFTDWLTEQNEELGNAMAVEYQFWTSIEPERTYWDAKHLELVELNKDLQIFLCNIYLFMNDQTKVDINQALLLLRMLLQGSVAKVGQWIVIANQQGISHGQITNIRRDLKEINWIGKVEYYYYEDSMLIEKLCCPKPILFLYNTEEQARAAHPLGD